MYIFKCILKSSSFFFFFSPDFPTYVSMFYICCIFSAVPFSSLFSKAIYNLCAVWINGCSLWLVSGSRMTAALLCFLLAAPVLLVSGSSVRDSNNGTVPLVLWHGMGEWLCCTFLHRSDENIAFTCREINLYLNLLAKHLGINCI